ncbi:hypothetical protein P280DRAFT_482798 [Massarina eburnea CBS 473.64]|uniref:Uncharacterized protein n=1 Tax=Massarina eburnea CBS 473.64 TaxID=1395130 RepID=A0A6A6RTJ5_9PLEO|nr:hypothetical protein P280DRAFT_482798 [Massarina eburnea CBS 473.64]
MPFYKDKIAFEDAQSVIGNSLPEPKIGDEGKETVNSSSLRFTYIGPLAEWSRFTEDVATFYNSSKLQKAFKRCEHVGVGLDDVIGKTWKNFTTFEYTKIGAEIGLHGRFMANATTPVQAVIATLLDPDHDTSSKQDALPSLPKNFACGDAKIVHLKARAGYTTEPDIVFTMPSSGEAMKVRLIGEVKSCSTYKVDAHIEDLSQSKYGIRNFIGQVARDMQERGIRFGFITTYKETVFVKISLQADKTYGLYYSKIVNHTDTVTRDSRGNLTGISVRLGILYLLYRVSQGDGGWTFPSDDIIPEDWIVHDEYSCDDGDEADPETTMYQPTPEPKRVIDPASMMNDRELRSKKSGKKVHIML